MHILTPSNNHPTELQYIAANSFKNFCPVFSRFLPKSVSADIELAIKQHVDNINAVTTDTHLAIFFLLSATAFAILVFITLSPFMV